MVGGLLLPGRDFIQQKIVCDSQRKMEKLATKAREVMEAAEKDYENWKEKVESVGQKAVFNHDEETTTIIYRYLVSIISQLRFPYLKP